MAQLGDNVKSCLFHLCQSVYRHVQAEHLAVAYNENEEIRDAAHMLCALAFVPVDHVVEHFDSLLQQVPEEFLPVADYFEENYVRSIKARGRRRAVPPRYHPKLWNQYDKFCNGFNVPIISRKGGTTGFRRL